MVRVALLLALALASGCAHRQGGAVEERARDLTVGDARFRLRWLPEDDHAARQVERILQRSAPRVQRWGVLAHPVTIVIHPSHEALEEAVQRPGYSWLKAWARYQTVDLQSPRTWGWTGVSDRKLEELLTHELTHCAIYQLAGNDLTWMFKEIPRWFSEGIATFTAGQGYRFPGVEQLWQFYERALPAGSGFGEATRGERASRAPVAIYGDPIVDSDPIYQDQSDIVYGAAYHAADFLIRRYGEDRVHAVLENMGRGMRFPAAFREAVGISDAEFAADFRRYVVWQGWRKD
ncbi:MAG TPA: hypothetical protein VFL83_20460 [Anaeromyxobacter sp.]|nr:hypothetical protein [Anaeromyxobacter sp.]